MKKFFVFLVFAFLSSFLLAAKEDYQKPLLWASKEKNWNRNTDKAPEWNGKEAPENLKRVWEEFLQEEEEEETTAPSSNQWLEEKKQQALREDPSAAQKRPLPRKKKTVFKRKTEKIKDAFSDFNLDQEAIQRLAQSPDHTLKSILEKLKRKKELRNASSFVMTLCNKYEVREKKKKK